jgi:hypothetical protein
VGGKYSNAKKSVKIDTRKKQKFWVIYPPVIIITGR